MNYYKVINSDFIETKYMKGWLYTGIMTVSSLSDNGWIFSHSYAHIRGDAGWHTDRIRQKKFKALNRGHGTWYHV